MNSALNSVTVELDSFQNNFQQDDHVHTDVHAYLNYQHGDQESLLWEYIDLAYNPTYVILDSGCARAMCSRFAIDRLVKACRQHKDSSSIWFQQSHVTAVSRLQMASGHQSRKDW